MGPAFDPQAFFRIDTSDSSIDLPALLRRLEKPVGPVDVVLDTDTYNEVDDQFALSYLVKMGDRLRLQAIYAAPFFNEKSTGPADGMEKSYREILTLLGLLHREDLKPRVYKGSPRYLPSETEPVASPAAEHLAKLAAGYTPESPLYVVALGAITNVASALLLEPSIRDKIVIVWLGGHAHDWPKNNEFNLAQDVAAARVVFGCGAAVVQLPCMGVVSGFQLSRADLETYLKGKNPLCDYLVDTVLRDMEHAEVPTWSRVIWDVTAVAWLAERDFLEDRLEHSPIPEYGDRYSFDHNRHFIRYVYHVYRDRLFADLVAKLTQDS